MTDRDPQDASSSQPGHQYRQVYINDSARAHLGDTFHISNYQAGLTINSNPPPSRFRNKHFEVPRDPSAVFTGREEILKRLETHCLPSSTLNSQRQQRRFVTHGLGGSGKTQVASVCALEPDANVVKRWLSNTPEPWVLILDNADDPRLDISPYFPVGNRGIVLITTRNPNCKIHATVGSHELGAMTTDEAITLILKTTGVHNLSDASIRETAKPVVLTLGCLALAIVQAGAVIREGRCRMEEYCAIYSRHRQELLSQKAVQDKDSYRYTVYTTWEVSRKMIEEMSSEAGRDAIELLNIFSFLHHDGISEVMFYRAWEKARRETSLGWMWSHQSNIVLRQTSREWDVYPLRAAVSLLLSFSLVNRDNDHLISIHLLVHTWARDRLSPSDQEMIWTQTISTVALSIPDTLQTVDYRFRRSLVPHIDDCLVGRSDRIFHLRDIGEDCGRIVTGFAGVYHEAGRPQDALQLTKVMMEVNEKTFGEEHDNTLNSMLTLALIYSETGRRQEALQLKKQVVKVRKRTLGAENAETLASLHSLACEYSEMDQGQKALQLLLQVVEARRKTLGKDDSENLNLMYNLAIVYSQVGRREEALQLTERVVEANMRSLGKENPETLASIRSLANRYSEVGRREEAVQLVEQAVELHQKTQGEEHLETIRSREILAICYSEVGRQQEALQLMEWVTNAYKRNLGEEHPATHLSIHSLASYYWTAGRREEALELTKQAHQAK